MRSAVDSLLGRVTMYRLVVYCLGLLVALALILAASGRLAFEPRAMLLSLAVLLIVNYVGNRIFAALFRVQPHGESSIITALLLFFILQPTTDPTTLLQLALAALFAAGSKYVLAVRGRHLFNPAAIGVVWLGLLHFYLALWWVGSPVLVALTAVLALIVLYRTRRLPLAGAFLVVAASIMVTRNLLDGNSFDATLKYVFAQTPLVFFAGFMLSEPLTLPPARRQQLGVAVVVGVLFAVPITIGGFDSGPETALVVGNLLAFVFGQRRAVELTLTGKRSLTPSSIEFAFRPAHPVAFAAGQYLELTLPHRGADSRGTRRAFSIASAPKESDAVRVGIKVAERGSTFKKALCAMEVGQTVSATGIAGDFRLPKDESVPLLLVAGGIGVTPFASQLAELDDGHPRDIVAVYVAGDPAELGYLETLQRGTGRVIVVTRTAASELPASVENLVTGAFGRDELRTAVPDIATRRVYVSGPPGLVNSIGAAARALKARGVRKDYFSGY